MYNYDILPKNLPENVSFCTMCFNLGKGKVGKIKKQKRDFTEFYLTSLEKLILRYKNVSLWVDREAADFIKSKNLKCNIKVMDFEDLPLYKNRDKYISYLKEMKKKSFNQGFLLKNLEPEDVVDYLILVLSKIDVVKWVKDNNQYNSDYFCWMDAGAFNPIYNNDCWMDFDGKIEVDTDKFKCTLMTNQPVVSRSLLMLPSDLDIALIKARFEIPAASWVLPKLLVDEFVFKYKEIFNYLDKKHLFTTEQAIFAMILRNYGNKLFEFTKTDHYNHTMTFILKNGNATDVKNDYINYYIKLGILKFVKLFHIPRFENFVRRYFIYPNRLQKLFYKIKGKK